MFEGKGVRLGWEGEGLRGWGVKHNKPTYVLG